MKLTIALVLAASALGSVTGCAYGGVGVGGDKVVSNDLIVVSLIARPSVRSLAPATPRIHCEAIAKRWAQL